MSAASPRTPPLRFAVLRAPATLAYGHRSPPVELKHPVLYLRYHSNHFPHQPSPPFPITPTPTPPPAGSFRCLGSSVLTDRIADVQLEINGDSAPPARVLTFTEDNLNAPNVSAASGQDGGSGNGNSTNSTSTNKAEGTGVSQPVGNEAAFTTLGEYVRIHTRIHARNMHKYCTAPLQRLSLSAQWMVSLTSEPRLTHTEPPPFNTASYRRCTQCK